MFAVFVRVRGLFHDAGDIGPQNNPTIPIRTLSIYRVAHIERHLSSTSSMDALRISATVSICFRAHHNQMRKLTLLLLISHVRYTLQAPRLYTQSSAVQALQVNQSKPTNKFGPQAKNERGMPDAHRTCNNLPTTVRGSTSPPLPTPAVVGHSQLLRCAEVISLLEGLFWPTSVPPASWKKIVRLFDLLRAKRVFRYFCGTWYDYLLVAGESNGR